MKVLFLATVMSHLQAFHEPYMEWFQKQGWEVHAAANGDAPLRFCDKKHHLPIERSPFRVQNIRAFFTLKKLMDREKYDIIHCHTPMGGVLARLAAIGARKKGTKLIYTAHGFHFFDGAPMANWLLYYPVEWLLSHVTDVLITINQEDYQRAKHFPAKRVVYVPGVGVDIDRFQINDIVCIEEGQDLSEEELEKACLEELFFQGDVKEKRYIGSRREKLRREFGILDTDIMLLSVGELIPRKNHRVVLEALGDLHDRRLKYVICGTGPLAQELKQKAEQLGLEQQIIFAGYRTDIAEICHAADIFVFPSLQEGLPVALMEAMAAGLPIVASRIRGNTDLIVHKKNGYLLQPTRAESYEKAIQILAGNEKRRKRFGKAARETVKRYSLAEVKKRMVEIYEICMKKQG